ncbi:hypothetical protein ACJMK2_032233 [Sinanodonta woodiana]|uniref:Uncharacterized protein n=1 Tax=Sinanodonta woodiana TaxID=1069815 RepID=A0ABD3X1P4_SINWO
MDIEMQKFPFYFKVILCFKLCTVNLALHKSAVQSTTSDWIFNWTADKAVDGNSDGSNPHTSKTCSATANTIKKFVNHTWEVNIGPPIIVKAITVYGRTDGKVPSRIQLYIFSIYLLHNCKD